MKSAKEILEALNALEIRRRLDEIVSEEKALRVLLRAANSAGSKPTRVTGSNHPRPAIRGATMVDRRALTVADLTDATA